MIRLICIISILLSLPALAVSVKRIVKDCSLFTIGFVFLSASLTATFISAAFHVENITSILNLGRQMINIEFPMSLVAGTLLVCSTIMNAITFVFVRLAKPTNVWKWIITLMCVFLFCNFAIGIAGSFYTKLSVDKCFFASCCASMGVAGVTWGLTYKEICVVVNIYMQGGILWLSALLVMWNAIRLHVSRKTLSGRLLLLLGISLSIVYTSGYAWLCHHYAMPMEDAYNLCYRELIELARTYHTTYNNVNYLIFIISFLVAVISNLAIGALIRTRIKTIEK